MAFTVSHFKSNIAASGGGARPSLYKVRIDTGAFNSTLSISGGGNLLVKAASIPPANIAPLTVNYAGRAYKWNGFRTFDPWTTTIINDENFEIRNKLQEWMRQISGKMDGDRSALHGDHLMSVGGRREGIGFVTQIGTDGEDKQTYKFYNLWPTELAEIPLDWASDAIQEYTVTWAYDYWSHGTGSSSAGVVSVSAAASVAGVDFGI